MNFESICKILFRYTCNQNSDLVTILTVNKIESETRKVQIRFLSGQRFVVLGRNSLKPFELISPDLYKISVTGSLSNHSAISTSDGFCSPHVNQFPPQCLCPQLWNIHHTLASRGRIWPAMTLPCTLCRQGLPLVGTTHCLSPKNLQEPARWSSKVRPLCLPVQVLYS